MKEALDAKYRLNYKTAKRLFKRLADQGNEEAKAGLWQVYAAGG